MKVENAHLIAAGRVLAELGGAEVAAISVDGKPIALESATQAYEKAESNADPVWLHKVDYAVDKLDTGLERLGDWCHDTTLYRAYREIWDNWRAKHPPSELRKRISRWLDRIIKKVREIDPENVSRTMKVEVRLADGTTQPYEVEVYDRKVTAWLQAGSLVAEILSHIPIFGYGVLAAAVAAAGTGGLVAKGLGNNPLASALFATAGKHVLNALPAVAGTSAVVDVADIHEMCKDPSIAAINNLGNAAA